MFIPALEYRKYIQRPRTAEEKNNKLIKLALRFKTANKSRLPYQDIVREIARSYNAGEDILSPDIFSKEDIQEFARENNIENDRTVKLFIEQAKPAEWWA